MDDQDERTDELTSLTVETIWLPEATVTAQLTDA